MTANKTKQVKNSFDKKTVWKIVKGALIAGGGAAALAILNYIGALEIGNPILTSLVAWAVPVLINLVKEWIKGE